MKDHLVSLYVIVLLLCFTVASTSYAQQRYSRFDHITSFNGLSSNRIQSIYRDSKEYLWIGADMGLNKYNGLTIKSYIHNDTIEGTISSDFILFIKEDKEHRLWIGTRDGLNRYNPELDNFQIFKHDPIDSNSIGDSLIISGFNDSKGNLWFLTGDNSLNLWNPKEENFTRYNFKEPDSFYPTNMEAIAEDSKGNLWICGNFNGLYRFDIEHKSFHYFSDSLVNLGNNITKSLFIGKDDIIWIATNGNGLHSYNPLTGRTEKYNTLGNGTGTNHNMLRCIIPENERFLLIGTDQGGINRFDKQLKRFEYIEYNMNNNEGLTSNGIWSLYKDKENILWVGTGSGGVNYYNPKKDKFKLYRHNNENKRSPSHNVIGNFYEDSEGMIWIATDGSGVNIFDPKTGIFQNLRHSISDKNSLSGDVIRCFTEDANHNMWIGTWDAGLNKYERKTGKIYRYSPDKNDPTSISGKKIWNVMTDSEGKIWLAVMDEGIDIIDKDKGVIKRFRSNPDDPKSLSTDVIWLIVEDREKNIWICSWKGLMRYNRNDDSFTTYKDFPDNSITAFCNDRNGNFWAGGNTQGLFRFDTNGKIIKKYDQSDGLPNNVIQAIVEDNNGNLWISTNMGISQFNPITETFRNYTIDDGLQDNQFFYQSFLKTHSGEIYFGGFNGFNSFFPDSLKENNFIPPVYIDEFQLFNKNITVEKGSILQSTISETKSITLTWDQSVFSFGFSSNNYTHPERNLYRYKMEGFDKTWNQTDATRRYSTYTNLDPGNYVFRVMASNNDGVWNNTGASINITILPPWWKTLFFRILAVLSILVISLGYYFYRINKFKKLEIHLENLVKERTSEVEVKQEMILKQAENLKETNQKLTIINAAKDKFFSIIAHDLKSPFNTILGFSDLLITNFNDFSEDEKQDYLKLINRSSKKVYYLLEDLLQWGRAQMDNVQLRPEYFSLEELIKANYELIKNSLQKKEITFVENLTENTIVFADRNMISTVLRNLLGNAVKYTEKGNISIDVKDNLNSLEINISDSGTGIHEDKLATLFEIDQAKSTQGTQGEDGTGLGLLICKEFIQKNKGEIFVKSIPGKGSTFTFTLPKNELG